MNFDIPHKCKYYKETESNTTPHDQFLQCHQPNTIKTKILFLIYDKLLTTSTPQSIVTIKIQRLTSYYNGQDTTDILHFKNNELSITQHQNAIGWDNFVRGRISKTFLKVITSHYKQNKMKQLPISWTSIVVGNIIDIHLDTWKDRFQDIHGLHIGNKEYSSNKDDLLATVKVYYEQSYLLSYQDKKWFGRDIALLSMMKEQSIRSWIKFTKNLISNNKRNQLKEKQHPITKYFHKLTSPPPPISPTFDTLLKKNLTQDNASNSNAVDSPRATSEWNMKTNLPNYTDDTIQSEVSLHQSKLYNVANAPPKNTGAWNSKIGIHGTSLIRKNKTAPSTIATEPEHQVEAWNSEKGISLTSPIRINEERQHHSSHLPGSILKSPNQSNLPPSLIRKKQDSTIYNSN